MTRLDVQLVFAAMCLFACEEQEEGLTCADPLQWTTGSMELAATVDEASPDAAATFEGSVTILFDCDTHADTFVFSSARILGYDRTTELYALDGAFAQDEISLPGDCTGAGTASKKVAVEVSGPTNEELFSYCGTKLWAELVMTRKDCDEGDAASQRFAAEMFVTCPSP